MNSIRLSSILLAVAVVLGAFGAHALKSRLSPESLSVWKIAVEYHFYHALGMMLVGCLFQKEKLDASSLKWITRLLAFGILFFSGSLYLLSTRDIHGWPVGFLGPITPIGGVLFISAWLLLAIKAKKA